MKLRKSIHSATDEDVKFYNLDEEKRMMDKKALSPF